MILLLGALVVLCIKLFCLKTKYFLRYVIIALLISAGMYLCKHTNNTLYVHNTLIKHQRYMDSPSVAIALRYFSTRDLARELYNLNFELSSCTYA